MRTEDNAFSHDDGMINGSTSLCLCTSCCSNVSNQRVRKLWRNAPCGHQSNLDLGQLRSCASGMVRIRLQMFCILDPVHQHPRPLLSSLEGNLWVAQHVVPAPRKLHVIRSWAAMNINIDGAPILGEHPSLPGFFNAVTSNGYTLGPIVGQLTSQLVLGRRTDRALQPFSISRFQKGRA